MAKKLNAKAIENEVSKKEPEIISFKSKNNSIVAVGLDLKLITTKFFKTIPKHGKCKINYLSPKLAEVVEIVS